MSETVTIEGVHYATQRPVRLSIDGGVITNMIETDEVRSSLRIAPGLIDNQVNGYMGVDFCGDHLHVEDIEKVTRELWKEGVTGYLPTLITNDPQRLKRNFAVLSSIPEQAFYSNSILGYHLEGPYISSEPGFIGCHPPEYAKKPDWDEFTKWQVAAKGKIIQVTLAPELEGAMAFIRQCAENHLVVGIGHTNASIEVIRQAVQAGAVLSTHLGNGCPGLLPRHHNPIWAQLDQEKLTATIIADGHHLPPELLRVFYKVKGHGKLVLTSDMTFPAGMKAGKFFFGGTEVELKASGRLEMVTGAGLAGASFPLRVGVENMMKHTGCTLAEAIDMASKNPARIYGLTDRGELKIGKRADLILFELADDQIKIKETYLLGEKVFSLQQSVF